MVRENWILVCLMHGYSLLWNCAIWQHLRNRDFVGYMCWWLHLKWINVYHISLMSWACATNSLFIIYGHPASPISDKSGMKDFTSSINHHRCCILVVYNLYNLKGEGHNKVCGIQVTFMPMRDSIYCKVGVVCMEFHSLFSFKKFPFCHD